MNLPSIIPGAYMPELLVDETIPELLQPGFHRYAAKTALIFGAQTLSYADLDHWSNSIANMLHEQGIRPGDSVGLWYPRSLELTVMILGILKAGAAYVPLDREMPEDRVTGVLTEVGAAAYFSDTNIALSIPRLQVPTQPQAPLYLNFTYATLPEHRAYVLYTSGSTGKPKGIAIAHRQICHLVRSEQTVLRIVPEDKVYQGFSVSFDMWCEETWISLFAGATLWIADATTAKSIDELSQTLREQQITILHAVPSLLAIMDNELPLVRVINAGGEACTEQVLNRWANDKRRFYNSYGPTETTVTATMIELHRGDKITIGDPLPNYNLAVVDEQFNILPRGSRGELVISGPGVCEGYVNRPDLTQEKFIHKPASMQEMPGDRIYRSGDAVVIRDDGSVDFQGRMDDQVKLRGYRIELGEIETQLAALEGISAAAVAIKKDNNDQDQLIGYVLTQQGVQADPAQLRAALATMLPPYMVPFVIVALDKMPRLPSGKIDRKSLPIPDALTNVTTTTLSVDPQAPVPERILAVLSIVFPGREISLEEDFFTDLGGHSLLAATFVSRLRHDAAMPQASLKDIYQHRPLRALSELWTQAAAQKEAQKPQEPYLHTPWWRYLACGTAQTAALFLIYGFFALQLFLPFLGYYYVSELEMKQSLPIAIATALLMFCLLPPLFAMLSIATKWLVIGKMKAGDYPLWGTYYFRWWFVKTMQRLMPIQFLNGTPLYNTYLRLWGVKVAPDAQLAAFSIGAEDLVTIGSDVSISSQVVLDNASVEGGWLKLRPIYLGDHAYVGSSAIVAGDARMEDWSELKDLSYLQAGQTIRPGEIWQGSPAQCVDKKAIEILPKPLQSSGFTRFKYRLIFLATLLVFPFLILLPLLPTIIVLNRVDDNTKGWYDFSYMPTYVPPLAIIYILLFALETILLTRLLQWRIKPGTYPIYSFTYVRKWFADQIMSLSLIVLHPIYATVYISAFFRALGARIGKHTEISTASSVTHPLLEIGEGSFIADAVTLGEPDVRAQQLILDHTRIGNRSFVGNSALIPQGYKLGDDMLIGVLSVPPSEAQQQADDARNWFGSPSIALPRRQESNPFPDNLTSKPSAGRKLARSIVEFIRIIIPETAIICFSILFIAYAHDLVKPGTPHPWYNVFILLPIYYLKYMGLPAFFVTMVLRWVFVPRYKAGQSPMWTWRVWRSEAITTTFEALSVPFLLDFLRGTPWLPMFFRLMGVHIGKRVWMNTTDITEYSMVSIGDEAALNEGCGPQTHLFEDRVMKVGTVSIGARTTIGTRSIILYDSVVGSDVIIEPLSLIMKGEELPDATKWAGSPVKAV